MICIKREPTPAFAGGPIGAAGLDPG